MACIAAHGECDTATSDEDGDDGIKDDNDDDDGCEEENEVKINGIPDHKTNLMMRRKKKTVTFLNGLL